MPTSAHVKVLEQLENLTFRDLRGSERLATLLDGKLSLLDTDQFHDRECGLIAQDFVSILQDVVSGQYLDFPIRAFAHITVALDYFVDPHEETPDQEPGGFEDDLKVLTSTKQRFAGPIERYLVWKRG